MMTATSPKSKPAKSQYKPHIQKEAEGVYTVQSESYGGHILYTQHVLTNGHVACDCEAGKRGKPCKHAKVVAALVAYNAHPMHLRPVVEALPSNVLPMVRKPATDAVALLMEAYA